MPRLSHQPTPSCRICRTVLFSSFLFVLLALPPLVAFGSAATVHGTRARNSSIPLRSLASTTRDDSADGGAGEQSDCDYCHPKECAEAGRKVAFCYVERDEENGYGDDQLCAENGAESIRRLVVGERLEPNVQSACQLSKRSPFVFVCWCKHVAKERSLSRHEQVLERNRLRFNAGRRGGLQVVHMLSADSRPAQFESLLKVAPAGRPSAQFDSAVRESDAKPNATATKPAESRGAAGWNGHLAHGKSNGVPSGSSGHELRSSTVRKTIPRRPSPARMAANRVEFSVLFVLIAFFSFVYIFH